MNFWMVLAFAGDSTIIRFLLIVYQFLFFFILYRGHVVSITQQFFDSYIEWLTELLHNRRHVTFFNEGEMDMSKAIHKVLTKKSFFGNKKVDNDVFKAEMNRLSRDNNRYGSNTELKLMDLFYNAADKIITDRYDNIN